ncbi:MAG: aspartate kinase [Anaerolineae bacterium]|nr:aspartate kinase [Anaerolineae bacterium]MDW8067364.1 aspartate kinase [Anaerolineae bacterium]
MLVMKFGGTSVGSGERMLHIARIVQDVRSGWLPAGHQGPVQPDRPIIVVVSAMSGVTDALLNAARRAATGRPGACDVAETLREQHYQAIETVALPEEQAVLRAEIEQLIQEFRNLCMAISILGESTPRGLDAAASLGERLAVRLTAAALRKTGIPATAVEATRLIVTDDRFTDASPLMDETEQRVREHLIPLVKAGQTPVVTGFIGATREGWTTTLGRGGSDFSAAILGYCLNADEVWIWTDVDGVMTADPRVVPTAHTIPEISYAEVAELAYFGAKVIHPKTIRPAMEKNIPIRILNTFNPGGPNTRIVAQPDRNQGGVKGITSIKGLSLIMVEGRGMLGIPGIAARVFSTVAAEGISVLMISQSSSEQSICFVIRREESARALQMLERAFAYEMAARNVDRIWALDDVAVLAIVGAQMRETPGIAARVFGALGRAGINVLSIAQGSSEHNLSLVVAEPEADEAVQAIHREFFGG